MADVVFMQVTEKSTNYKEAKSDMTLFETAIKDIVRKIKDAATPTLDTVIDNDFVTTGLLEDIQTKQEQYKTNFSDYQTEIINYVATDPRADISAYTAWQYLYTIIDSNIIEADDDIAYNILRQIMNNEGYYHERRINFSGILWYIRNIIITTNMFGYYEVNASKLVAFTAIAEEDLILDDIYDVLDGGDTTMIVKSNTLTYTGSETVTLAADEILQSIDIVDLPSIGSGEIVYIGVTDGVVSGSDGAVISFGQTFSGGTYYVGMDKDTGVGTTSGFGKGLVPYVYYDGLTGTTTLTYTTRKIINYT